jgi:hypothetical protein
MRLQRWMTLLLALCSALLVVLLAYRGYAQEPAPENRIGQMSEAVIANRLQQLGYGKIEAIKLEKHPVHHIRLNNQVVSTTQYEVTVSKDGQPIQLKIDRLSGQIEPIR